ncbi:DUF998 domain-containing protein [Nocardioides renjunii]|uniref:DUF998 domain-containing protein n=1 Tax=Nocardioides renjunii TaxID=3095075 RepID=UPI002AFE3BDF|nr:DUF998 domain-containing protein [Nocardioides sp. S-34]WQQ22230.1 DUF998 domain-containing protein [Nocardioides sp. S-34]
MPDAPSRAARLGALLLLLRPTYIATEVVTAAATTGGYSFVSDSVSRLGEVGCTAAYCSPRHAVMNGSFMVYGVLLAGGALLLAGRLGPWVTGLLVVSGVSSVATGLAPLDQDATLHTLAAAPLFVAQPAALLLLGARLRGTEPRLATGLQAAGVVTAAAAVGFVVAGEGRAAGALERLALWPVLFGLVAVGWSWRPRRGSVTTSAAGG